MVALFFKRQDQTLLIWAIALAGFLVSGHASSRWLAAPFAARVPDRTQSASASWHATTASAGIESYPESIVAPADVLAVPGARSRVC